VRSLDSGIIQIVGAVMGQTVALDHYLVVGTLCILQKILGSLIFKANYVIRTVNRMLEVFMNMNSKLEQTGNFKEGFPTYKILFLI